MADAFGCLLNRRRGRDRADAAVRVPSGHHEGDHQLERVAHFDNHPRSTVDVRRRGRHGEGTRDKQWADGSLREVHDVSRVGADDCLAGTNCGCIANRNIRPVEVSVLDDGEKHERQDRQYQPQLNEL